MEKKTIRKKRQLFVVFNFGGIVFSGGDLFWAISAMKKQNEKQLSVQKFLRKILKAPKMFLTEK